MSLIHVVNHAGLVGCSEAVVYVDDADAAGTGVEHGKECGEASEAGSVTDAGGHGDDGAVCQSSDRAGECSFHPGDDHDNRSAHDLIHMAQQTVNPGYADIVQANDLVSKRLCGQGGFLRYRYVTGSSCGYKNISYPVSFGHTADHSDTGERLIEKIIKKIGQILCSFGLHAGDQNRAGFLFPHHLDDLKDLLFRLSGSVNHFRSPLTQTSVQINLRKIYIYKWLFLNLQKSLLCAHKS